MAFKTSLLDLGRKTMIIKSFGAGGGKSFDLKRQVLLERNPTGKEEKKTGQGRKKGSRNGKREAKLEENKTSTTKHSGSSSAVTTQVLPTPMVSYSRHINSRKNA